MIETRPLLSMLLAALLVATVSGCDFFDNPLPWEESPIADDLVGTWKAAEGQETGVQARVSRTDKETLGFELAHPENTSSTLESDRHKQRTTFLGNVLGSGSLHVLQVRMDSYDEFDKDGESLWNRTSGFLFFRIVPSPNNGVHVHRLNSGRLGRVAEKELAASRLKIERKAFERCLDVDSQRSKIDPYEKLSRIRDCVVLRLPSESLEQLFLDHADLVFSGGVDRYVRE